MDTTRIKTIEASHKKKLINSWVEIISFTELEKKGKIH